MLHSLLDQFWDHLFPEIEEVTSGGDLHVAGWVQGPLGGDAPPRFGLDLDLLDGFLDYPALGKRIEQIGLALQVHPDRVEVTSFEARTGARGVGPQRQSVSGGDHLPPRHELETCHRHVW